MVSYPYSDEYMVFDETTNRYVLTTKYVYDKIGVDMEGALKEREAINTQILANRFLVEVSDDIYDFIHKHNANTARQDYWIAVVPSLRNIIQKAMEQQFVYSRLNGLLGYSADKDVQTQAVCPKAQNTLAQIAPELGISILYTGGI
jgi:predicted P-loop ATPase